MRKICIHDQDILTCGRSDSVHHSRSKSFFALSTDKLNYRISRLDRKFVAIFVMLKKMAVPRHLILLYVILDQFPGSVRGIVIYDYYLGKEAAWELAFYDLN